MLFLDYVVQVPVYDWKDTTGKLVVPINSKIAKEFFSTLNIFKSRRISPEGKYCS